MIPLYFVPSLIIHGSCAAFELSTNLNGIMCRNPLAIAATCHILHPNIVLKIPAHRFANTALKCFLRLPSEFSFDLACVHRVAAVVSGPISDKRDQAAAPGFGGGSHLVDQVADRLHDLEIGLLIPAAHVVS